MLTRRSLLQALPLLVTAFSRRASAGVSTARAAASRRYVVQITLGGGFDAIFTTDPKERSEIDPELDLAYGPKDILHAGKARFGPHMAPFLPFVSRMTVVNGVLMGVANHHAGVRQLLRLRSGAAEEMPLAIDLIGEKREGQALPSVSLSGSGGWSYTDSIISPPVWTMLDKTPPDELRMMARVMRTRGGGVQGIGDLATRASIEACADFFDRLATTPPFKPTPDWLGNGAPLTDFSRDLQRTLWLVQNDLTRCVMVGTGDWDTHSNSNFRQTLVSSENFPLIAKFLSGLDSMSNKHGSLFSNTVVLMSSELGRNPVLNREKGKDHFPEAPVVFFNAGGEPGVYGKTGRHMQALPFAGRRGGKITLTDIGATLLRLGGVNPETCGYAGEPIDFLGA